MPSRLSWIDHDHSVNEAVYELLNVSNVIDELGFASVRDSISDTLFPGTSTLHTRLRYVLFIKWLYQVLEATPSKDDFEEIERNLVELTSSKSDENGKSEEGAFGKESGRDLERLPSMAYSNALLKWGIRNKPKSKSGRSEWTKYIHQMTTRQNRLRDLPKEVVEAGDFMVDVSSIWNPALPGPPVGFPKELARPYLDLTHEEAVALRNIMTDACKEPRVTLFGDLLENLSEFKQYGTKKHPWDLIGESFLCEERAELLEHAENYSRALEGAVLFYHLLLAEAKNNRSSEAQTPLEPFEKRYHRWWNDLRNQNQDLWRRFSEWNLDRFFSKEMYGDCDGHRVWDHQKDFLKEWVERLKKSTETPPRSADASKLIEDRERRVKGKKKSRFENIDHWAPDPPKSDYYRLYDFRWSNVKQLLKDLDDVLNPSSPILPVQ